MEEINKILREIKKMQADKLMLELAIFDARERIKELRQEILNQNLENESE